MATLAYFYSAATPRFHGVLWPSIALPFSRTIVSGQYVHLVSLHQQHERFAKVWDNNLRLQGFAEAFEQQQTPRA